MALTAFITGATAGIGFETARLFHEHGYHLIVTGRREERLLKLRDELGDHVDTLCFDIQDPVQVKSTLESINLSKIDILINNAGLASGLESFHEANLEDWERMIDTNIKGLLYISRMISPFMVKNQSGHIVNVGSVAGKFAYPKGNVYSATKYAVNSLSQGMRIDLCKYGIKVSQVSPGLVETEFSEIRFHGDKMRAKIVYEWLEPLNGRDVAEAILWMVQRPKHVNINDIWIMPTAQASPAYTKETT